MDKSRSEGLRWQAKGKNAKTLFSQKRHFSLPSVSRITGACTYSFDINFKQIFALKARWKKKLFLLTQFSRHLKTLKIISNSVSRAVNSTSACQGPLFKCWMTEASPVLFLTGISIAMSFCRQSWVLVDISSFPDIYHFQSKTPASLLNPQGWCSQSLSPSFHHFAGYWSYSFTHQSPGRKFSHIRSISPKRNLQRLTKLMGKILKIFLQKHDIQNFPLPQKTYEPRRPRWGTVRSSRSQMNQLSSDLPDIIHTHSAANQSPREHLVPLSVTSTKLPPPQVSCNFQPWDLAAVKALADTVHTNLKTHTVSEILLT